MDVDVRIERRQCREDRADALKWIALARSLAATLDLVPRPLVLIEPAVVEPALVEPARVDSVPVEPGTALRVWHANAAARERLAADEHLPMRDGVLVPAHSRDAAALGQAIAQCFASGPGRPCRVELGTTPLGQTVHVQLLDFGAGPDLPVSRLVLVDLGERATAGHGSDRLRERYRLTRKEAECAIGLYAVGSVDRFARCSGKSVHTVRTQLKAAMQKTATNTQAALVALVANAMRG